MSVVSAGPGRPPGPRPDTLRACLGMVLSGARDAKQLARGAGVRPRTAKGYAARLVADGWLADVGGTLSLGRRAGELLTIAVSRERLRIAVVNAHGSLRGQVEHKVPIHPFKRSGLTPPQLQELLVTQLAAMRAKLDEPAYVAACCTTWPFRINRHTGQPEPRRVDDEWRHVSATDLVRRALQESNISIGELQHLNDADCEAIAEHRFGQAAGRRHLLVIKLSAGLGLGCVVHGRLVRGAHGYAGELGHLPVQVDPQPAHKELAPLDPGAVCSCGKTGHLQCYASLAALVNRLEPGSEPLFERGARLGNRLTESVVNTAIGEAGKLLGQAVCGPVAALDPAAVVLRPSLFRPEALRAAVQEQIRSNLELAPDVIFGLEGPFVILKGAAVYGAASFIEPRIDLAYSPAALLPLTEITPASAS